MIEPQGPLPPEIYWRRRVVAGVGALAIVGLVIALIVWTTSGSDDPKQTAATPSSSEQAQPTQADPSESATPDGQGGDQGGTGQGNNASGAPPTSASTTPGQSSAAASAPAPVPASGLCPDQNISVVLYTDKPTYKTGDQPQFTIVTTNAGLTACTRDVGKAAQNVVVRTLDGTRTLWSARDCSPLQTVNNQLLQPAQQVRDNITWSGTTSSPGCNKPRVQIPVGAYQAVGKIGERESAPITFNVVAPAQEP
ncbi:hypothetical protein [Gordonia sp. CPCC 205333]|uniref:hypothetical protein n=1 Tax=Gordonia sp. CPCC 205333 TaxID=3140790 RepID=UPI003AF365A4